MDREDKLSVRILLAISLGAELRGEQEEKKKEEEGEKEDEDERK